MDFPFDDAASFGPQLLEFCNRIVYIVLTQNKTCESHGEWYGLVYCPSQHGSLSFVIDLPTGPRSLYSYTSSGRIVQMLHCFDRFGIYVDLQKVEWEGYLCQFGGDSYNRFVVVSKKIYKLRGDGYTCRLVMTVYPTAEGTLKMGRICLTWGEEFPTLYDFDT